MADRDRLAAIADVHAYNETESRVAGKDACDCGYTGPWHLHLADVLIAAGVTMPAPPKAKTDRELCWCGESAESTGWGVCEKHFDVDRCNKPQGDPGRFCILSSGHEGKCW